MLMTAAGTIPPAKVLVLGAGVAGLQAIATARRLGAVVSGFDVRPVVKEQVESLGATFLDLGVVGEQTEGGYAKELTPEQQAQQQQALNERIPDFDVVDHDGAHPRPAGAAADPGGGGQGDEARLGDRRPRRRGGRQLRADRAGRDRRARGRDARRADEPALDDGEPREPALRAQRERAARPDGKDGALGLDWDDEVLAGACVDAGEGGVIHLLASQSPSLIVFEVTILVLAIFLGIEVISKVPTMLHTPLMSGTNAIHGIVIVGAILVAGSDQPGWLMKILGFVAVILATANVVGGFVVTDRMLEMFKPKKQGARRRGRRTASERERHEPALPADDRQLRPRAALPVLAEDGAPGKSDRRARDGDRDRRDARAGELVAAGYGRVAVGGAIGARSASSARAA